MNLYHKSLGRESLLPDAQLVESVGRSLEFIGHGLRRRLFWKASGSDRDAVFKRYWCAQWSGTA